MFNFTASTLFKKLSFSGCGCIIFVLNHTRIHKNGNLCRKPWCKTQA